MSARWRRRWATISSRDRRRRAAALGGSDRGRAIRRLPAGLETLADHVERPPELRGGWRRSWSPTKTMRPAARGRAAAGHPRRALRRWDGFVALGGGAAAAERLMRANRLAEIDRELPGAGRGGRRRARTRAMPPRRGRHASARDAEAARRGGSGGRARARATRSRADDGAPGRARTARRRSARARRTRRPTRRRCARRRRSAGRAPRPPSPRCPIRQRSQAEVERGAARRPRAPAGGRRQRAPRRPPGARNGRRPRAPAAAGREAGEWRDRAGARRNALAEAAAAPGDAWPPNARSWPASRRAGASPIDIDRARSRGERRRDRCQRRRGRTRRRASGRHRRPGAPRRRGVRRRARGPRRRGGARRGQDERARQEYARISGERFECPPPLLPERSGFDAASARRPRGRKRHARAADRRARADRPGQSGRRTGTGRARPGAPAQAIAERDELAQAVHRLRGSIGSLNREGRRAAARRVRTGRQAFPPPVHDPVRRRPGASRADR